MPIIAMLRMLRGKLRVFQLGGAELGAELEIIPYAELETYIVFHKFMYHP